MRLIELQQNTPSWLEWRKEKIGSSDAPIIMGVSPWATKLQLWERKLGICSEQNENFSMVRGKALEHEARCAFMQLKGITVAPEVIEHPQHNFLIASLDGLSVCEKYAVEIKVPGREAHLSALSGIVPDYYMPQLQHQLAVTGLNMIYYYSYDGKDNACIEVQRDQEYIDKLIEEELKFYKCMVTCTPPELSERDYNIRTDREWEFAVVEWQIANNQMKIAEYHEKEARQKLIEASQSRNSKGCGVKVQKIMRAGSVRFSEIPQLQGVDLDRFRKPATESWRITEDEIQ